MRTKTSAGNGVRDRDCISVGDVVILKKDFTPRGFWKLAKVEQLIMESDRRVRAAVVKVARSNNKRPVYLRRVIQHLVPLEVGIGVQPDEVNGASNSEEIDRKCERRNAAVIGEMKRRVNNIV